MRTLLVALVIAAAVAGIAAAQSDEGIAASRDVFDKSKMTASHKKPPFGTKVKVTNLEAMRSSTVHYGALAVLQGQGRGPSVRARPRIPVGARRGWAKL